MLMRTPELSPFYQWLNFLFCGSIGSPAVAEEIVRQQSEETSMETSEVPTPETAIEEQPAEEENVKDTWDESSAEEEEDDGRF